ncbi:metallophosphoesterase family protein [Streptomyces sp. NBC_01304]|uniref:metallophosphoesterase family protein n=1 Tax=Streptomyces sp. NBC_01304 TaxID=2903818 RepID=UPI002E163DC1|nr:metallophosphoesterase [Streptomyces sp. NBC_01304]
MTTGPARLLAVSDLHVHHAENRKVVEELGSGSPDDWLIVAGDVGEFVDDIARTLGRLRERFAKVVWAPGNHELWTHPGDRVQLRGAHRYEHLVEICRGLDVITPEDPYPVWRGEGGPAVVAPLFVLYDYSFLAPGARDRRHSMDIAERAGVVCTDELLLHPDPYPSRQAWCAARVAVTEERLAAVPDDLPTVLVNHFPLRREPTRVLRHPEFAQWCGTEATADWPRRFRAAEVVYGHLHIPRLTHHDGVPHREVSLGYPREWLGRSSRPEWPVRILDPARRDRTS